MFLLSTKKESMMEQEEHDLSPEIEFKFEYLLYIVSTNILVKLTSNFLVSLFRYIAFKCRLNSNIVISIIKIMILRNMAFLKAKVDSMSIPSWTL